jgi:hypothetical protein
MISRSLPLAGRVIGGRLNAALGEVESYQTEAEHRVCRWLRRDLTIDPDDAEGSHLSGRGVCLIYEGDRGYAQAVGIGAEQENIFRNTHRMVGVIEVDDGDQRTGGRVHRTLSGDMGDGSDDSLDDLRERLISHHGSVEEETDTINRRNRDKVVGDEEVGAGKAAAAVEGAESTDKVDLIAHEGDIDAAGIGRSTYANSPARPGEGEVVDSDRAVAQATPR